MEVLMKRLKIGTLLALVLCAALCLSAMAEENSGSAPVAENLEICTYRGVSVGGQLSAVDPDGGELRFEIVTPPNKGSIELNNDGSFVYTPGEGRKGKDYFGYKAIDSDGNASQEATVIIRILKQKTKLTYSDLKGSGAEYAAVKLAEQEVFTAECLAGSYVFSPDKSVTRSEFLAMCMKLRGSELLTGVRTTGFADDEAIAVWAKPYVSTALKSGIISGYAQGEEGAVFNGNAPISVSEAAVMLDKALELTDVSRVWYSAEEAIPVWAAQSTANLIACGVMPESQLTCAPALTRADAAEMLVAAMDVLDNR